MNNVDTSQWRTFTIGNLFNVVKGSRLVSAHRVPGDIPYVGATMFNNGITGYIGNDEKLHPGEVLTVCYNGPVGTTFYQPSKFWATDDVNVLYPRFPITEEIGLFIAPIIQVVGSRYAYIDKWKMADMVDSTLRLPATSSGEPDWGLMESMMKERMAKARRSLSVLAQFGKE